MVQSDLQTLSGEEEEMSFTDDDLKRLKKEWPERLHPNGECADGPSGIFCQTCEMSFGEEAARMRALLARLEAAEEVIHVREHAWKTNYGEEKMEAWRKACGK